MTHSLVISTTTTTSTTIAMRSALSCSPAGSPNGSVDRERSSSPISRFSNDNDSQLSDHLRHPRSSISPHNQMMMAASSFQQSSSSSSSLYHSPIISGVDQYLGTQFTSASSSIHSSASQSSSARSSARSVSPYTQGYAASPMIHARESEMVDTSVDDESNDC